MLDLYLILIPVMAIVFGLGLWVIRGLSPRAYVTGKVIVTILAFASAGLVAIAYLSSIVGLIILGGGIAYSIYIFGRNRYAN